MFSIGKKARHILTAFWAAASVGVSLATASLAQPGDVQSVFLDDDAIRSQIAGRSLAGIYFDDRKWAEHYDADGSLRYSERGLLVSGYWTLDKGVFCTLYHGVLSGGCWRVRQVGANCFEFYHTPQSTRAPERSHTARNWTAKGWRVSEPADCEIPQTS